MFPAGRARYGGPQIHSPVVQIDSYLRMTFKTLKNAQRYDERQEKLKLRVGSEVKWLIIIQFRRPQLFAGHPASVMAPAGRAEQVLPFLPPTDVAPAEVAGDCSPFMKDNVNRAGAFGRLRQAISARLVFVGTKFRLKGSEELIPDDQEHAHIFVEIFGVGGVVDPVMGGRDKEVFEPAHFLDKFSVNKNAPDLGRGIDEQDVQRFEPGEREGNEIEEAV